MKYHEYFVVYDLGKKKKTNNKEKLDLKFSKLNFKL